MIIVLDTNVFWGDVYARKAALSAVFAGAANGDFQVLVPEVVVAELVHQFPSRLSKAVGEGNKAIGRMEPELRSLDVTPPSRLSVDVHGLVEDYEPSLRARLSGVGVSIAAHPATLSKAVDWSVQRRKPFKENAAGLADAAVWLTVMEAAQRDEAVVLVTANKNDFGDGQDPLGFAPELLVDLTGVGIRHDSVRLIIDLDDLIREVVAPRAQAEERARRLLATERSRKKLRDAVAAAIRFAPLSDDDLDLPMTLDEPAQAVAVELGELRLRSVRPLPEERLLLELDASADLTLTLSVDRDDLDVVEDDPEYEVVDYDAGEHYVEAETTIDATIRLSVATDPNLRSPEVRILGVSPTDPAERAERWLLENGLDALRELVAQGELALPNVSAYSPPDGLHSPVETASALRFEPDAVRVEAIDDVGAGYVVGVFVVSGTADVHWTTASPTPADVAQYGSPEGDNPQLLSGIATAEPIAVFLRAALSRDGEWSLEEILRAELDRAATIDEDQTEIAEDSPALPSTGEETVHMSDLDDLPF